MEVTNRKRLHIHALPVVFAVMAMLLSALVLISGANSSPVVRGLVTPVIQIDSSSEGMSSLGQALGAGGESRTPVTSLEN